MRNLLLPWLMASLLLVCLPASAREEGREPTVYVPTTFALTVSGGAATEAKKFVPVDATDVQAFPRLSTGYYVFAAAGYRPTFGISEVWWKQRLAFELALSHAAWTGGGSERASYLGAMAGARLDLLVKAVRPWIAQHAGYGSFEATAAPPGAALRSTTTQGMAIRFSGGLDYAVNSFLRAGVQAAWHHSTSAAVGASSGQDWYELGASVGGGF